MFRHRKIRHKHQKRRDAHKKRRERRWYQQQVPDTRLYFFLFGIMFPVMLTGISMI